ncbi:NADPH-dependent FMN reductase [soil metagenome]
MPAPLRFFALCGSLRAASVHLSVLRAAKCVLPQGVSLSIFEGLAAIPPFNPDLEGRGCDPESVLDFRSRLRESGGLLIASPEYAHGVPGVLKNALDWIVGSGELSGKPVAVLNASLTSTHAWNSLVETIRTMDARLIDEASIRLPLPTNKMTAEEILAIPALRESLAGALSALALADRSDKTSA